MAGTSPADVELALLTALRELLAATPGNYLNVGRLKPIVDNATEALREATISAGEGVHAGHPTLCVGLCVYCSCGVWTGGVFSGPAPAWTKREQAHSAAIHAYLDSVTARGFADLTLPLRAMVDAALDSIENPAAAGR